MKKSLCFISFLFLLFSGYVFAQDTIKIDPEIWARNRKDAFKLTTNDSLFVANNSDVPFGYRIYNRTQDLGAFGFMFFGSMAGEVIGPITTDDYAMLFKVVRYDSTYRVRLSHIFLQPPGKTKKDTAATVKKAEKYLSELKAGKNFEELVKQASQDSASVVEGGDLGWFFFGTAEKPINEFIKSAKKNDMAVIRTMAGVHIFRLTEERQKDRFRVVLIPLMKKLR
jgi:peptidyl-prolyl cis-trans isomerase D